MFFYFVSFSVSLSKVLIFDAGSSATRIYGYQYENAENISSFSTLYEINSTQNAFEKTEDTTFYDIATSESAIETIMTSLIKNYADLQIPESQRPNVLLLIYATGDVRKLPQEKQDEIVNKVYEYAKTNTTYRVEKENVRILNGVEEGIFGWISVNQLLGNFDNRTETKPVYEIGGSSAQIVFELTENADDPLLKDFVHNTKIGKESYNLFSYSFLGFGCDNAAVTLHRKLLEQQEGPEYESPCVYTGFKLPLTIDDKEYTFVGNVDYDKCYDLISNEVYIQKENIGSFKSLFYDNYSQQNVPLPHPINDIYGLSTIQYQQQFLKLPTSFTLSQLEKASKDYSLNSYDTINNDHLGYDYTNMALLQQLVSINFMKRGLNSSGSTTIDTRESINGVEPRWTLAAVISAVSADLQTPTATPDSNTLAPGYIALIVIVCVLVVAGVCVGIYFVMKKKNSNSDFQEFQDARVI